MNKIIALILALAVLGLTACGGGADSQPSGGGQTEAAQPAEGAPAVSEDSGKEPVLPDSPSGGEEQADTSAEEALRVSHEDVTLRNQGDSFRLTVWDVNGNDPDACTYTSADPEVAAVDGTGGEVTAVAPGTTTVTAHVTYGGGTFDFDCIVRCNWEQEATPPASGTAAPSLEEFFSTLQGAYEGLNAMMVMEGEVLDSYYPGLSSIAAVEEVLIQETMISISNIAVGLVKLDESATPDDFLAVQAVLQDRMTAQAEGGAFYPASCETWENGVITSASNCVGMFVYPDSAQEMADLFTTTFSS